MSKQEEMQKGRGRETKRWDTQREGETDGSKGRDIGC